MSHALHKACEAVDAFVFSSDVLDSDAARNELKSYIARWSRAIAQHEAEEKPQGVHPTMIADMNGEIEG